MPLDLASLPVPQSGLSLLAVSTARTGVRIYDEKHHVDTIKMIDSVSSLKVTQIFNLQKIKKTKKNERKVAKRNLYFLFNFSTAEWVRRKEQWE